MALPVAIVMKLRIISRSLQTFREQKFIQIELQYGHTIFIYFLNLSLRHIYQNSEILSGITWRSCRRWRSWLRHCINSGKGAGSVPDDVI
jgi:hypothetical protein